jgi:hypothetical protein
MVDALTVDEELDSTSTLKESDETEDQSPAATTDPSRRRFTTAVVIGMAVVAVPYLWVLWDLWTGTSNPLRKVDPANFYDLQARAMSSGHLYVPGGRLGIEAFIHSGHQYTYFGVFPSILRMPILAFTQSFDGRLTAPSMLLAWLTTGLFSSLLLWRTRLMIRGRSVMGRAEAASFGVLVATIAGGSVLMSLAASPWVYNEDFAWSAALTTGSIFALLGVLERPSWGRVTASGVLILAVNLNRAPAGYGCTIGALLVAAWFALGRGGASNRRWTLPVLAAGLIPLAANCAVTWAKFGLPIGLPMADQIWAHVNLHRRQFLAANGGKAFSFGFLPSTLWAYMQPAGLHVSSVFPYIGLPTVPARALGGAVLDQTYPTSSVPSSMPLLFLLSAWGVVTTFRPRPIGQLRAIRLPLVAAASAAGGVLLWGYIAERYLTDLMPFLILASGVGMIDIWRRCESRSRQARGIVLTLVAFLGIFGVVANVGIASTPTPQWTTAQTDNFVAFQHSVGAGDLATTVERGPSLPYWAPAGQLFVAGNCSGLYRSTGISYATVPGQQVQHLTWAPIEQAAGINHTFDVRLDLAPGDLKHPVPLLTFGGSTLVIEAADADHFHLRVENPGETSIAWPSPTGWPLALLRTTFQFNVMTDPNLHSIVVSWDNNFMIGHYLAGRGPAVVQTTKVQVGGPPPRVTVTDVPLPAPTMSLCRSLIGQT